MVTEGLARSPGGGTMTSVYVAPTPITLRRLPDDPRRGLIDVVSFCRLFDRIDA